MKESKSFSCFKRIVGAYLGALNDVSLYAQRIEEIEDEAVSSKLIHSLVNNNLRLVVVGSVAAFDRYFTERFIEGFLPYTRKYKATKVLGEFLMDCGADIPIMLEIVRMQRPGSRIKSLVAKKLQRYVTQNPEKIDKIYRCYGLPNLLENAQGLAKRKTILREVFWLINLRHEIVHQGHADRSGKLKSFTKKDLKRIEGALNDIFKLVDNCEKIMQKRGI